MTAKEYLGQAYRLDQRIDAKLEQVSNLRALATKATATISDGSVFIRGGINAIVNDGSCYAQLTSAEGESIRENTILLQNPSTTDCKTIAIQTSSLSSGSWSVKLYYSSNTTEGVSNEASFEIK